MTKVLMNIKNIKPSQLYINQAKIERLATFNPFDFTNHSPLPIKRFGNDIFFTDGHTRALLYFRAGIKEIPVYWDQDFLNMELYKICLEWCQEKNMAYMGDLDNQIVSDERYHELWIKRCEDLARRIALRK
ncbi:hypothetical protein ACS127_12800 [Amphibacillus sp. Q70]|uniref:hypothetical protein n=1 Tax=Amphibacillus sp. Q70 TaxID=3453416 RepID=UPI003F86357A